MYFGIIIGERLVAEGVAVTGSVIEKYCPAPKTEPLITFTHTIKQVITRCNSDSFNLAAECLIKTISAANTPGSINGEWPHGLKLSGSYLCQLGYTTDDFTLDDGCGLSRKNRLTAAILCDVLNDMYNSPNKQLFKESLAVGGVRGSSPVRKYFTSRKYKGRVLAKSGTINGVKALSGICKTDSGDYTFSIIVNKANGHSRKAINDIVEAIIDSM